MQVTVWPRDPGTRAVDAPKGGTGGIHFTDLGDILEVNTSTRFEEGFGGFDLASWTVKMAPGYAGGFFLPRDHVEISDGGGLLFSGEYSEQQVADFNEDTYTFHARGYAHVLNDYEAVATETSGTDYSFPTTQLAVSDSDTIYAWERARSVGMQVYADEADLPSGAFGASAVAPEPLKLGTLLTAHLQRNSEWWACWGPELEMFSMPTTPTLLYDQPNTMLAVADTDYYSAVGLYFIRTSPGTSPDQCDIAWGGEESRVLNIFDRREIVLDMRGLGLQTLAAMEDQAQTMYEQVKGRRLLTGTLGPLGEESGLKAANGGGADIRAVRAGVDVVQLVEVRDSIGYLLPEGDSRFTVGRTEFAWSSEGPSSSMTISPMGAVARNLDEVLRATPMESVATVAGSA